MEHSALLIADYIIAKGDGKLTPLQVNKLTYIAHGYTLACFNEPLVKDQAEAWRYGPVFPSVYHAFSVHNADPIPNLYYCHTIPASKEIKERITFFETMIDDNGREVIDRVLEGYKDLSGGELINITHAKGTPWSNNYKSGKFGIAIPDIETMDYYKNVMQDE